MRALVIDGNARIRARLAERLVAAGVDVFEAASMVAAVEALAVRAADAVLFDVHIRPDGGLSAVARLRGLAPRALIVVLTNEAHEILQRECLRNGADAFLDKSKEFDRAVELVVRTRVPTV